MPQTRQQHLKTKKRKRDWYGSDIVKCLKLERKKEIERVRRKLKKFEFDTLTSTIEELKADIEKITKINQQLTNQCNELKKTNFELRKVIENQNKHNDTP